MKVESTSIEGVLLLTPTVWRDTRGSFSEAWQCERYAEKGMPSTWVQDNVSRSRCNVLRGLHFQYPAPQGKLLTVLSGSILDVAVDVRRGAPTFGTAVAYELSAANGRQLYIAAGLAHGFLALEDDTAVHYKCTGYYHPANEHTLLWNDQALGIHWPSGTVPLLSDKDAAGRRLADFGENELPAFRDHW